MSEGAQPTAPVVTATEKDLQRFLRELAEIHPLWRLKRSTLRILVDPKGQWIIKSSKSDRDAYITGDSPLATLMARGFWLYRESQLQWRAILNSEAPAFIDQKRKRITAPRTFRKSNS